MVINNVYNIGDIVYVKTDPDQTRGIVTGITVRNNNNLIYTVDHFDRSNDFYEFELSDTRDYIIKTE